MDPTNPSRPRVSRETRLLIAIVLASVAALWVLSRIRFPERAVTPNPVPLLFTQLAPTPGFADLASTVSDIQLRLAPALVGVTLRRHSTGGGQRDEVVAAVRLGDDLAVTLWTDLVRGQPTRPSAGGIVVARDRASGLAILRTSPATIPALNAWSPRRLQFPRYFFAAAAFAEGTVLRPVFIGALHPVDSPIWSAPIWTTESRPDVPQGTFLFTTDGALAGLVIERDGRPAIVPGETVLREADRLQREGPTTPGQLGVDVRALTPAIASVTGASAGVVITWVDPTGPAADKLFPTDVVETADAAVMHTPEHWAARTARLTPGDSVVLRVRRRNEAIDLSLTAASPTPDTPWPLGLSMRTVRRVGVEILRVDSGSAAARAGIKPGDVIIACGGLDAPTPAQVTRAFATAPDDRPMLVAITRDESHDVIVVVKR